MNADAVIDALALPANTRVDRRIPKTLLREQGAATSADKRRIQEGIEELSWVAVLKPSNIGVSSYRDDVREYSEIAVLSVAMRARAKVARLVELIHRAIPYPTILISTQDEVVTISLAHKRLSRVEIENVVVEDVITTAPLHLEWPSREEAAFVANLALSGHPAQDLFALYQGWMDCVNALAAARVTGRFMMPEHRQAALARTAALDDHGRLQREITLLCGKATKESQISRRVELNLEIRHLEAQLAEAVAKL